MVVLFWPLGFVEFISFFFFSPPQLLNTPLVYGEMVQPVELTRPKKLAVLL